MGIPAWLRQSYPDSARRTYAAAVHLRAAADFDTAGHLFGVAAECAVKAALERANITVDRASGFREHFPKLRRSVLMAGQTRHMHSLLAVLAQRPAPLNEYVIDTRYSQASIDKVRCATWQNDAQSIMNCCGFVV